jgi:hypothetical protein
MCNHSLQNSFVFEKCQRKGSQCEVRQLHYMSIDMGGRGGVV